MFSPTPMLRLSALVLERDARRVLQDWGEMGAVQLTRTKPGPDAAPLPPRDRTAELGRCNRLLARIAELSQALEIPPPRSAAPWGASSNKPPLTLAKAETELELREEQAGDLLRRRRHLGERLAELTATAGRLVPYRGLEVPLDGLNRFSFLRFVTGSLPEENWEELQRQTGDRVALLPLPKGKGPLPLIAMTTERNWPALEVVLRQSGFQVEPLPVAEGETADSLSVRSEREREHSSAELERVNAELQRLAAELTPLLEQIEWLANREHRLLEAEQNFPRTEIAVLLTGWIPADNAPPVFDRMMNTTGSQCVIEVSTPGEPFGEDIPILLRHPRWLRPFEMLVSAYGLPGYRELVPTLFVALSYVLMFGMMFGDVGHGTILAVGGLTAWFSARSKRVRDAGLLLLFGGLASCGFGFLYGSCLGLESFKQYALWKDPLEGNPMTLMQAGMAVGVVLISLGLVLNVINRLRRGDVLGACLDKFGLAGVLFYWGALALLLKSAAIQSRNLMYPAIALFLAVPVVGWALKEPLEYALRPRTHPARTDEGGLLGALTESLVGAFEAVLSYLANTISFVRLAAYAMSHAALLAAAFTMAEELKPLAVGGGVLSVLVIVLGNLVAIVLEGIVASVQALRLEYYEFFGKFFSGDGQPFRPFCLAAGGRAVAAL